jgi:hypothetical protein
MRLTFLITLLILKSLTTHLVAQSLPTVQTSLDRIRLYMNGKSDSFSGINQLPNPFTYSFETDQQGLPIAIVSEMDSIAFVVRVDQSITFRIIREQKRDTVICRFTGLPKKAVFNQSYIRAHKGKSVIEIPEVYELINVLFALTAEGQADKGLIDKDTEYYRQVMAYFKPVQQHPAVSRLDSLLKAGQYHSLKMDSYAYVFKGNQLEPGDIFNRVSWGDVNTLTSSIPWLADFAIQANFRSFYKAHEPYYDQRKQEFNRTIALADMKQWLDRQFPKTSYDCLKIIASPLVASNQSANWFDDNGFRETQAHINLPDALKPTDNSVIQARRQEIVFTELNHAYENPAAETYSREVNQYFTDLSKWTAGKASLSYQNAFLCFQEYMNWALVSLYHSDHFTGSELSSLRQGVEARMVEGRGFSKFRAFNQELLRLYQHRKPGETVSDLYPALFSWVSKQ